MALCDLHTTLDAIGPLCYRSQVAVNNIDFLVHLLEEAQQAKGLLAWR